METLLDLVDQFGYIAMFLFSWIVFLGLPVPNEIAAAFAGYISEWRHFNPYTSFLFMYSGLISYGMFGFLIGKRYGTRLLLRFFKSSKTQGLILKSETWIDKYGLFAISISYFIPGIRLVMPYIAGTGKGITLLKFLLYAVPSAGIWALVYFQIGRYFPVSFQSIVEEVSLKAGMIAGVIVSAVLLYYFYLFLKKRYPSLTRKRIRYRK
ncbi:DedA family protein [Bacillus sp. Marseille-Q1617]|uniref:DedA family protein n=1 Tax=Bacillus sp. Marseille-Q1617 TaxID=2736887 RepID=UPI00158AA459|nr:DedA family protein [Bacillus sp. Marseille-Q1617]